MISKTEAVDRFLHNLFIWFHDLFQKMFSFGLVANHYCLTRYLALYCTVRLLMMRLKASWLSLSSKSLEIEHCILCAGMSLVKTWARCGLVGKYDIVSWRKLRVNQLEVYIINPSHDVIYI